MHRADCSVLRHPRCDPGYVPIFASPCFSSDFAVMKSNLGNLLTYDDGNATTLISSLTSMIVEPHIHPTIQDPIVLQWRCPSSPVREGTSNGSTILYDDHTYISRRLRRVLSKVTAR